MGYEKNFERKYSLNVARLKPGKHEEDFEVDNTFFEHFEKSLVNEGEVKIHLSLNKTSSHLDTTFFLKGWIELNCDRCGQLYPHEIDEEHRIIFSFKENTKETEEEVIYVDPETDRLVLTQEIYDFIHLAIPMRKVPDESVHACPEEVKKVLGLTDNQGDENQEEQNIDPRWAALKKLREELD